MTDDLAGLLASLTAAENAEKDAIQETKIVAPVQDEDDFDEATLLADLKGISGAEPTPVTAEAVALDEADLAELENTVARTEAYLNQPVGAGVADATETTKKKSAKTREPNATKAPRAPKTPRTEVSALPDAVFEILTGSPIDKAAVIGKRPVQVKVAEKFDNLFHAIHAGKEPSSYVVTAFRLLKASGTMTSADLVNGYKAEGLGDGTAQSQKGQIFTLFDAVCIAARSGQTLTLRADSAIAAKLSAILGL